MPEYGTEDKEQMPIIPNYLAVKADIIDKIRPERVVEVLRHKLMGEELIDGQWVKVPYLVDRAISEKGAFEIANLMLSASSQNVAFSDLKDAEIRKRLFSIVKTAVYMCIRNWKEYGIKSVDQIMYVYDIVYTNTFVAMKQSMNEGIRRMFKETVTEVRREELTPEGSNDSGFFSSLLNWRRR
jgi:hypothetical protein